MKYQGKDLGKFPEQIRYALTHFTAPTIGAGDFENIILCGLGGSGIAGRIVKSFYFNQATAPVEVISDYVLPSYASKRTLAIMCSYSGNTEETIAMYKVAKEKGCRIIVIATGGTLGEMALEDGNPFYQAVSGFQPRMALGYSLTYLFLLFDHMFGKGNVSENLLAASNALDDQAKYLAKGQQYFDMVKHRFPAKIVVITDYFSSPIGLRFCQQIQENAKAEAFLHELPETNHNVIESYYGKLDSVFVFMNSKTNHRTDMRFEFVKNVLKSEGNDIIEIEFNSQDIQPNLEIIYALDWFSLIMADNKGVNSSDIRNIIALKKYLSER